MKAHVLKCWPEPFRALLEGRKTHEFRRDDRGFAVGDVLVLKEFVPGWPLDRAAMNGDETTPGPFTGREVRRLVTYVSRGPDWGIPEGFAVMSLGYPGVLCTCPPGVPRRLDPDCPVHR